MNYATEVKTEYGLPQDFDYSLPVSLPSATNLETVIAPINGTSFIAGQVVQFDIPCSRNSYFDTTTSMVRYKITYNTTGTGSTVN
jgi:hypothetical protein